LSIDFTITTTSVAWYAAIVSTLLLVIQILNFLGGRVNVVDVKQSNPVSTNPIVSAKPIAKDKPTSFNNKANNSVSKVPNANSHLVAELNKCRESIARREGIKPYMVFTDSQLNAIIEAKPINERELLWIEGIDDEKVYKYGKEIIKLML